MKILPFLLGFIGLASFSTAQDPTAVAPATPVVLRTAAELEQLLGPIALYPDALIALMLPASTVPADIVLAARQMQGTNDDRTQVELRAWDDSVKSLTHYPDVLRWMDENLEWTKQVGEAFLTQPAEVMNAIQRLRARARAAGTLVDTPQQQVLTTANVIRIVPAQSNVIYVPSYEPSVVYVDRPIFYPIPPLRFGAGFAVGSWLAYDCDWTARKVWVGDRHRRWHGHDWRRPIVSHGTTVRHWQPTYRPSRPAYQHDRGPSTIPHARTHPPSRRGSNAAIVGHAPPRSFETPAQEYPGPRAHPITPVRSTTSVRPSASVRPSTSVPSAPGLVSRPSHRDFPSRHATNPGRSLPNVIAQRQLPVAPPLPAVAPPLGGSRHAGPRSLHTPSAPSLQVAPPLPTVAPSLPATVPTFTNRSGGSDNSSPTPITNAGRRRGRVNQQ